MYRTARETPLLCLRQIGNRCPEGMKEFVMEFCLKGQVCPALLLPGRGGTSGCTTAFGCSILWKDTRGRVRRKFMGYALQGI